MTSSPITNYQDIIDSRDIIERIADIESYREDMFLERGLNFHKTLRERNILNVWKIGNKL